MTDVQGEAVKYTIEQEREYEGQSSVGSNFCIESITANQKIPLRGNTVIKYRAIYHYIRGQNTQCLSGARRPAKNDVWANFERDAITCGPGSSSPIEVGGKRYHDGSAEI